MSIADRIWKPDALPGANGEAGIPDSFWRSLNQLNAFRFFLAIFFLASVIFPDALQVLGLRHHFALFLLALMYLAAAFAFAILLRNRRPAFKSQLVFQLAADIFVISVFIHFGSGSVTGLGLLLTVPMAAAGLHPQTRIMLSLASAATIAVLGDQALTSLAQDGVANSEAAGGFVHAAMLAVGFFTVAGISHMLAKGTLVSARVADEKGRTAIELERVNAHVIQDLPYGVAVIGPNGQVVSHNQHAVLLLRGPGQRLFDIEECDSAVTGFWRNWVDGKSTDVSAVFSIGEPPRRIRVRLSGLAEDRLAGAVLFVEDLSELEHEAMQMKLASLGRLTASLAHEIRNPLSAINHASQLLREDAVQDPGMVKLTRIIEDNVVRLNSLVEDVLLLSRRDRHTSEKIELGPYLHEFVAEFCQAEQMAEETVAIDVGPDLNIDFDRMHLHQILWNLMRNAHRYCSHGQGSIVLTATANADMVQVELYNDGPAIPAEIRQRLFEPFYSTDRTGTGLGLYISLELAEVNSAQLRCIEQTQGARFRLSTKLRP